MSESNNTPTAHRLIGALNHGSGSSNRAMAQLSGRPKSQKHFDPHAYRAVVWLLVAIAAVTVWFAAPTGGEASDWSGDMTVAEFSKTANDKSTEGAPQQQVVNGWFVADTIPILSEQVSALHTSLNSGRIPGLMLVFGLGYCADVVGRSLASASQRQRFKGSSVGTGREPAEDSSAVSDGTATQ
ncbi:hypothetical protein [Paeniglutamicibacter sp. Y32M11]|uniref:hypothetical protein n=1 Tax=Paeniglutamicibacter sp. Y32M11 TaxID=2853258 RepID=UPI001C5281FE|nr:hypothetical protein [Paeniglutamicibacter sp. Y32M11]QXQ10345.1 hypothetical protein KUF55_18345 [Paeniglutamicibacter sp. Y32M11]